MKSSFLTSHSITSRNKIVSSFIQLIQNKRVLKGRNNKELIFNTSYGSINYQISFKSKEFSELFD